MECKEKLRLSEEYFAALKRQHWIRERLELIRTGGNPELVSVGERQENAATEECYDAWREMNHHDCSNRCEYR